MARPCVSDHDPLAKLPKPVLAFVTINTHVLESSGMERLKINECATLFCRDSLPILKQNCERS
jgi:hypothetical protein